MMKEDIHLGYTIKTKFFVALLAGFLSLGGIIALFGMTSTAFALPVGGMGDFYVKFEKLEGEDFSLHPHIGETSDDDAAPLVRNKMEKATIEGLHIYKDLKLPGENWIRINVTTSQPATIKGLVQDAKVIDANLSFGDMEIKQKNTSNLSALEAFKQNWTHQANKVTITDAEISTAYLFQSAVNLQAAQISIELLDGPYDGPSVGHDRPGGGKGTGTDHSTGGGGILPKTGNNYIALISMGALFVLFGALFIFRKKLKFLK